MEHVVTTTRSAPPVTGPVPAEVAAPSGQAVATPGAAPSGRRARRDRHRARPESDGQRGLVSPQEWRRHRVRFALTGSHVLLLGLLVVWGIGPMVLLVKFAVTPTQDILRRPLALFPTGIAWENLAAAWNGLRISHYFLNSVIVAFGAWLCQIVVATTGGYVLSVLRPRYGRVLNAAVLATLFVPAVVLLVPLYLTVLRPPVGPSLLNTFWAVWLPAGASAFNVVLVTRFFDSLPREVFEAARVDGAGPFRLFWSIVLPMSKPILGVVSVFAVIASWKDFLWPLLVLPDPELQPLSVRLPALQGTTDLGVLMAALAISTLIPVLVFLLCQRLFLRGAGLGGAVKG
jgi:multiple sugar transport system permease protein